MKDRKEDKDLVGKIWEKEKPELRAFSYISQLYKKPI